MSQLTRNTVHTIDIDSTGEVARFEMASSDINSFQVGLELEGSAGADYEVDLGSYDQDGNLVWFENVTDYPATSRISDAWVQTEYWMRIRVTAAAAAGNTAQLLVSVGH